MRFLFPSAACLAGLISLVSPCSAAAELDYNRDVRPILSENCFACHGFDEKARKGKLRLDVAESAYAERNGLIRIKPGDPANSEVWLRISSTDEEEVMPPPDAHSKLTEAQKLKIKTWIDQGAKYAPHWSFVPPRKAELPPAQIRPILKAGEGANPIDVFVQARLVEENLKPSPEAS